MEVCKAWLLMALACLLSAHCQPQEAAVETLVVAEGVDELKPQKSSPDASQLPESVPDGDTQGISLNEVSTYIIDNSNNNTVHSIKTY